MAGRARPRSCSRKSTSAPPRASERPDPDRSPRRRLEIASSASHRCCEARDLSSTADIPRFGGSQSCRPSDPRRSAPTRQRARSLGPHDPHSNQIVLRIDQAMSPSQALLGMRLAQHVSEAITQSGNFSRLARLHENSVLTERAHKCFSLGRALSRIRAAMSKFAIERNIHPNGFQLAARFLATKVQSLTFGTTNSVVA